ncbi:MAG: hypothetical protein ACJ73S_07180 [Mycobacteriales bacterium]
MDLPGVVTQNTSRWLLGPPVKVAGPAELTAVAVTSTGEAAMVGFLRLPNDRTAPLVVFQNATGPHILAGAPADSTAEVHLNDVAVAGDDVWAVGSITAGGVTRPRIERYSRCNRHASGQPVPVAPPDIAGELRAVTALGPPEAWAVGWEAGDRRRPLILHDDGVGWVRVPAPDLGSAGGVLNGVAAVAPDDVWAVGHLDGSGPAGLSQTLVLRWNGDSWKRVDSLSPGPGGNELLSVAAAGRDDIWCAGFTGAPGPDTSTQALLLRYDGVAWQAVPPAVAAQPAALFSDIAVLSGTDIFFAGYAEDDAGGVEETFHIEHWNGQEVEVSPVIVDPPVIHYDHPASGVSGIAAGSPRGPVVAVGWLGSEEDPEPAILRYC